MFDITLRRWKDRLADPCARLVPAFIGPGHLTLAAFYCGIASCWFASKAAYVHLALALWLCNRFLDCLDGSVARLRNVASSLGGFHDLLSDFVIYSLLPISVAIGQETADSGISVNWPAIALLEASFHVNNFVLFYSAAVAAQKNDKELTSVTMRPALIEGFESGLLFTAMLILPHEINKIAGLMSAGVVIGILQRAQAVHAILDAERKRTI